MYVVRQSTQRLYLCLNGGSMRKNAQVQKLEALGYIRLREKSEQLIASIKPLIAELEDETHDQPE